MSREPVAVISADDFAELDDAKFGGKVYAYVRGQGGYQQWLHGVDAEGEPTTEKLFVPLYAEPPEVGELVAALRDIAKDGCALKSFGLPASVLEETCTCPRHRARAALAKYEDKGGRVQ